MSNYQQANPNTARCPTPSIRSHYPWNKNPTSSLHYKPRWRIKETRHYKCRRTRHSLRLNCYKRRNILVRHKGTRDN